MGFVQANDNSTASGTSVAVSFTNPVTAGNMLIALVEMDDDTANFTVADNRNAGGWTTASGLPLRDWVGTHSAQAFQFPSTVGAATMTVTVTTSGPATSMSMMIAEYTSVTTLQTFDKSALNSGAGTTWTLPIDQATHSYDVFVTMVRGQVTASAISSPFTMQWNENAFALADVTSNSLLTPVFTVSAGGWNAAGYNLLLNGTPPPPPPPSTDILLPHSVSSQLRS